MTTPQLTDDLRALLDGTSPGHLATLLPDGAPHTVPVWVGTEGDDVVFFTGPTTRKARNLDADPRVAISLTARDDPFTMGWIRGHVVEKREGDPAWEVIDRLSHNYTGQPYPREEEFVVYRVEVDKAGFVSYDG